MEARLPRPSSRRRLTLAEWTVFKDEYGLAAAFADRFAWLAQEAVDARGRFLATLSGGQTPLRSYRLLGVEPHKSSIPWNGVHVFWGD
ncbi:MAG: 6-phosphogluconolactonase, partial [Chloroflexi bacterium]|nr:6-phosphogluconolactonase [Chloroflexota bacterium]